MSNKLNKMAVCLAMGTALGLSGAAWGQDADAEDPNVTVQDRERPDFDPLGIRAGSFLVFPELSVEGGYDSNVFATDDAEEDDLFSTIRPERATRKRTTTTTRTSTSTAAAGSTSPARTR